MKHMPLLWSKIKTQVSVVVLLALVCGVLFLLGAQSRQPFVSKEARFTDASPGGLAIVPASCPSYAHYGGECDPHCNSGYFCSGNDFSYQAENCGTSVVEHCSYECDSGGCIPPPPTWTPFTIITPSGQQVTVSGGLTARPLLVRPGYNARLYWNVSNVSSCEVNGSNGDAWTGASSGAAGQESNSIGHQVVYKAHCVGLPRSRVPSIDQTVTVNVAPTYQER